MSGKRRPSGAASRRPAAPAVAGGAGGGRSSGAASGGAVGRGRSATTTGRSSAISAGATARRPGSAAGTRKPASSPGTSGPARDLGARPDRVDDAPPGAPPWVPWLAFVLCALALADSGYLTYTHFNPGALVCSTTGLINCTKVTTSPQSYVFGIPVAILGLGFYAAMTVLNLPRLWRGTDIRLGPLRVPGVLLARLRLAGVVVGIGMVVYLVIAELFLIKNICEYCTGVHILTFVLFVVVVLSYPAVSYRARWLAWSRSEDVATAT